MKKKYAVVGFIVLVLFLIIRNTQQTYEICDDMGCKRFVIDKITQPSMETTEICNPNAIESGAENICEKVPDNRLLFKGGTNKNYCSNAPYLSSHYLDNWWNAEGLIDECEMPPDSNMQFIFKRHDQSIKSHDGTIQIKIDAINYDNNGKALQIFIGEDNNNDNLPDEWKYCGNVDEIRGRNTKYILCNGNNLKFIKLVNAEWNKGNLYIDSIEVLKA